ncbi:MAG: serine hydrolase [Pseudomonadota bacterium]|nr:serine hydrolase [Pseudomonadota bacterium]
MNPINQSHYPVRSNTVRAGTRQGIVVRAVGCLAAALLGFCASHAFAGPALVIEMPSGAILYEDHATQPWYPASLTKLMTVYVALSAVRDHRIALDTPFSVSARAAMMPPSKMGFRPGSLVTLDNALKMLMVKSANDMAVVIAEGVSGSVEAFAEDMNSTAREIGLTQSHFVNPNGLPNPEHVSSARDLAILARALYLTFPEQANLFNIGALRLGGQIIPNHNNLLGRYPGVDGMKTGFTCAAGFNLVASASQGGRKLIAVILGAPNLRSRTIMAAALFDRGFAGIDRPSKSLADLAAQTSMNTPAAPPDMHQMICRKRGKAVAQFNTELDRLTAPLLAAKAKAPAASQHFVPTPTEALARPLPMVLRITMVPRPAFDPVPVYAGAPEGYAGLIAQARPAHSPVGTAQPPGTVSAYAPATPGTALEDTPLPPDAGALPMKDEAKQAKSAATPDVLPPHRLARSEIGDTDSPVASKTAKKASHKASKKAQGKAPGRKASFAKANVHKHSKFAAKFAKKAHFPAKATADAGKTKSKTPEKHARR